MRPALWMAAALAVGIAAAEWLRPHPFLAAGCLLAMLLWATRLPAGRRVQAALLLIAACLGALLYSYDRTAGRGDLEVWAGERVELIATVVTEPELRKPRGVGYIVRVERVNGHPARGKLYVSQWSEQAPAFGERVHLKGTLKEPLGARFPGGYDRARHLGRQGVYLESSASEVRLLGPGRLNPLIRAAVATRIRLEAVLKATMPPEQAALTAGLLFGSRSELPEAVKASFKATGVFHLLAVSGGNIAMIVLPLLALLQWLGLGRRGSAAVAIPVVIFFVFLTGASPSVLRAGLMAVLVLLGDLLQRERNPLNTLGAAGALLLLLSPGILFDLGFQFSFLATLGILLLTKPIEGWLAPRFQRVAGKRLGGWLATGLAVTFAAQLLVEPISLHNFGAFSAIAPIANLVVLAFLEPVVKLGTVAVLVGLVWEGAAWLLNLLVRLGLWLLVTVVNLMAAIPGAYAELGRLPAIWIPVWYGAVLLLFAPTLRERLERWLRVAASAAAARVAAARTPAVAAVVLLLPVTGATWGLAVGEPADRLSIHFLDVGQGDAILIKAPGGRAMLVDAGAAFPASPERKQPGWDAGAEVILPYLRSQRIRKLDYLVLTHPDQDHAGGGAAVLRGVSVDALLHSGPAGAEKMYGQALAEAAARRLPAHRPVLGDRLSLGPEVVIEVLNPLLVPLAGTRSDDNSNCVAFRLRYRRTTALFTCDIEAVVEARLVASGAPLRADLLKVSHHGSGYSTTAPFLEAVRPRWAVISAGAGNAFGHPHAATLERLQQVGAEIYRTDRHGTVVATTDGYGMKIAVARQGPAVDAEKRVGLTGRRLFRAW